MTPEAPTLAITRLGDEALIVSFTTERSAEAAASVRAAARRVREMRINGVTDVVPAYTSHAVYFDEAGDRFDAIVHHVHAALVSVDMVHADDSRLIEIPVIYDGPDIAEVAERTGLTVREVIERHSSRSYHAYMSGFVPGFAYLGDLDPALVLPRRSDPRVRVPAGSVAIAGEQTAVYPLDTPGGWHLIGRTSLVMFDAGRLEPALVRAGDTVRFVPVHV